jgi:hypothetical protein
MSCKRKEKRKFTYRDTTNVEHEMYDDTGSNWNHRNSNNRFKAKRENHTRKTFD